MDEKLIMRHQVEGFCCGIIFCAYWTGATSEQVALIRLPATITLTVLLAIALFNWIRPNSKKPATPKGSGPS